MDKPRPCGCKGRRTCLTCEEEFGLDHNDANDLQDQPFRERMHSTSYPSRGQSSQSCSCPEKNMGERTSYCTAPLETRADFDFSDCQFPTSHPDIMNDIPRRPSSAPLRSAPKTSSSQLSFSKDKKLWSESYSKPIVSSSKLRSSEFAEDIEVGPKQDSSCRFNASFVQSTRYHARPFSKFDNSCRHRKAANKLSLDLGINTADTSDLQTGLGSKLHRTHRPKPSVAPKSSPIAHPKRGVGRVGVQVSINDCVCIASSADLGTATDSLTDLRNKRHVLTWASRIPSGSQQTAAQPHDIDSDSQIDILSSTPLGHQEGSEQAPCNCICQPQPPQSAADYYHSMQSRPVGSAAGHFDERDNLQNADSRGVRGSLTESQQFREDRDRAGQMLRDRLGKSGVLPGRFRKKRKGSLRDWQDPHKLYPDPLRWGGERPYRWEDNLRNTETNALIAVHPQRWMPVGKQQYSHHHGYPSWPEAITNMMVPWSRSSYCCDPPQYRQRMICSPDNKCGPSSACYPAAPRTCPCEREKSYVFCPWCQKAWPGWDINLYELHPNHKGEPINYPGIFIHMDWLSEEEEIKLVSGMDQMPWDISQSGRRKQNFGPKCNFKKRRMRLGDFIGFPTFSKFLQDKFHDVPILEGYLTVEQCSLEYDPSKGASIDRHIDDCWVWGERIVTVNLLSDSVLTMTPYNGEKWRYNLPLVSTYNPVLNADGVVVNNQIKSLARGDAHTLNEQNTKENMEIPTSVPGDIIVRIPMPRRSLLVIFGSPRYEWEHRVLREDIHSRRLCLAYREFTPPYLPGGEFFRESEAILQAATKFWDNLKEGQE